MPPGKLIKIFRYCQKIEKAMYFCDVANSDEYEPSMFEPQLESSLKFNKIFRYHLQVNTVFP